AFILQDRFRAKGKATANAVEITIYTTEKSPMENFGPRVSAFLTGLLEKAEIPVVTGCSIRDADPSRKKLLTKDGEYPYDLILYVPVHRGSRSEEHTSELQSRENLVCRLLLEKKKETAISD